MKFQEVCEATGVTFRQTLSYLDHKNKCKDYKIKKNEFFEALDKSGKGTFPIMDRRVDMFYIKDNA